MKRLLFTTFASVFIKKFQKKAVNSLPNMDERQLPEFNAMQRVKRRFFAMRNGDLAQQMAERGAKYRINFGLNLPQISEIARDFQPGGAERENFGEAFDMADFARRLRDNVTTRESMLIAPMLFPAESLTMDEAVDWIKSINSAEVADVLCLKLLRNWPGVKELTADLLFDETPMIRYCALRLLLNLLQSGQTSPEEVVMLLSKVKSVKTPLTDPVLFQLFDEISFMSEEDKEDESIL